MIRAIDDNIWTVVGPDVVFAGATMHTRMTVVRLSSGQLWVHSPIAWSDEVERFVDGQGGDVVALVAPNKFHYLYLDVWREHHPEAVVFAEADLKKKVPALQEAEDLDQTPPALWSDDIDQLVIDGHRLFQEAVFFHRPSRSLIFTDLFINLRLDQVNMLAGWFLKFEGVVFPNGGLPRLYRWLTSDKDKAEKP
ncbi:MAG: DUF4336 domain-containing protein [Pseudomonadales bacterium]|nr:DUF4336 domain-containing protein [Pseudomonadales bacterium]